MCIYRVAIVDFGDSEHQGRDCYTCRKNAYESLGRSFQFGRPAECPNSPACRWPCPDFTTFCKSPYTIILSLLSIRYKLIWASLVRWDSEISDLSCSFSVEYGSKLYREELVQTICCRIRTWYLTSSDRAFLFPFSSCILLNDESKSKEHERA